MATFTTKYPYLTLELSCHCKRFSHTITFPTEGNLPLKSSICHCKLCRQVSGQLWASFAVIPEGVPWPRTDGLKYHQHQFPTVKGAETRTGIKRYFCPTCGASVINDEYEDWEIATGVIDRARLKSSGDDDEAGVEAKVEDLLDRVELFSVTSTGDGGGAIWVNGGSVDGMERHEDGRTSALLTNEKLTKWKERKAEEQPQSPASQEILEGTCACGSVKLSLKPSGTKYPASLCACWSCRKTIGFEISCWFFVPKQDVLVTESQHNLFLQNKGRASQEAVKSAGLTEYCSSEGKYRYFCSNCGLKVMYTNVENKTTDLNPGMFFNEERARLEKWLEWHPAGDAPVSYPEDAIDHKYVGKLIEGVVKDTQ